MNKHASSLLSNALDAGAMKIAGIYLLVGSLWILFSDQLAAQIAVSQEMLALIGLYKGWGYVLITALLLYALIRRHTARMQASEMQLKRILDALPALISYVDKDQYYRFTNRAYQDWFEGDAVGKHVQEVFGTPAYQAVLEQLGKVLRGETVQFETEMPFPHGERIISAVYVPDIDLNGQVEGFFTLVHDVTEQKQAREEQRLWADAFEGCAHGIAIADPNTNRIVVCNPAFARLHKSRVENIVGSAILSLYASSDHESVRHHIQKADQIGHARFEVRMVRRDGSTFPVQMDLVSVLGEDGEVLHRVATAQDISERRRAEEKLKESEEKYRTLVEHLPAITYISEPDQYIGVTYISPQIETLGFDQETWLTDHELWFRQIHADDQAYVKTELERFKNGKEPFNAEYRLILPDGQTRWFHDESISIRDGSGKTVLKQGFMVDITERKEAEQKLRIQASWLEQINDAVIHSDKKLAITAWNSAAERIYGWKAEEVIGKKGEHILQSEFFNTTRAEVIQVLQESGEYSAEITQLRKDGVRIYIETRTTTLRDESGHAIGYVSVNRDITERKHVEETLRLKDELLRLTSEMAKVGGWEFDPKTGKGTWTDEVARIHDLDPAQDTNVEIGMNFYLSESRQKIEQAVQEAVESAKPYDLELEMISARGTHKWVRTAALPIVDEGKVVKVQGIFQDITERVQAEENLRRFELLSKHSRDIILFMGNKDGQILEANAAAVQAYGHSRDELLGLTIRDLRASDTVGLTADQMAKADAGGILFETVHRRKDGSTFPVEVSSQGATIRGTRALISIIRDITERKDAEKALMESEARFRSLFEQSFDANLLLENGIFTDCNQATVRMMRAENKDQILFREPAALSPDDQPDGRSSQEKALELMHTTVEKGSNRFEWTHRRMDGTEFPVEVVLTSISAGDRPMIHTVWRDITERKQIERDLQAAHDELEHKVRERTAALSEANALLQALMDNIPDHIYFKDTQSRFIRNSRSQASLLGLQDSSQTIGKTDFDFFPHAAKSFEDEQEIMRTGQPHVDFEEWVVWPGGREMWVTTTKMPLRNAEGETIGIFGISHDITERKRAEQAIRQLNADLETQAEQLQAANKELEAFSYSVSHDLRAPLRAIDGYTRILVEDYESALDDEGKRVCGVISREARRMGQLIDDLLAFSRLGRKEMYSSRIDMRGLAVAVLNELLKEENQERLEIHVGKLPEVKGDSSLIRQVWVNLLSNAIKFTSKTERPVIDIGSKTTRDEFIYHVRDNGAGFDMEYVNKLFGVFQRLHSESEFSGTGVGLAIVQRIIRRHNGRVWAEAEVEKGATFYFALPRKESLS